MEVEDEMRRASKPATDAKIGDTVTGSVYNFTDQGAFLLTSERYIAFLHVNEMMKRPKVGDEVTARITFVREDGRINVSMRPLKEEAMDEDAEKNYRITGRTRREKCHTAMIPGRKLSARNSASAKRRLNERWVRLIRNGQIEQKGRVDVFTETQFQ